MSGIEWQDECDVIVIGGGLGGLICAGVLAKRGKKVKVLEQGLVPGGYVQSFRRNKYNFDATFHYTGEYGEDGFIRQVFEYLGITSEIEMISLPGCNEFQLPDGRKIFMYADIEKYISHLAEQFPKEKEDNIRRLYYEIRDVWADLKNFVSTQEAPLKALKYKDKTWQEMMDEFISDPELKMAITTLAVYMGLPSTKLSAVHMAAFQGSVLANGVFYPKGGSQKIPNALVKGLKMHGGEIELLTKVTKIHIDNGVATGVEATKMRTIKDGDKNFFEETSTKKNIMAKVVVSNASATTTMFDLVGKEYLDAGYIDKLESMEAGVSYFVLYLGLDIPDMKALGFTAHDFFICKSWDFDSDFTKCLSGDITALPLAYTIQTLIAPELAPEGKNMLQIMAMAPYSIPGWDWDLEKDRIRELLIEEAALHIPELKDRIEVVDAATPLTMERYTGNYQAAGLGWAQKPGQTLFEKPGPATPIPNILLTGQWSIPGGAIIGVAISGWIVGHSVP